MFIKRDEMKTTIKNIVDRHGQIHKLWDESANIIGYLIRYEKYNNANEAGVVFNISINEHYYKNEPKTFIPKSAFKYFAIKHAENFDILKNKKKLFILNEKDSQVTEIMIRQIDNMLKQYFFNECIKKYSEFDDSEYQVSSIYNQVFTRILNVMKYYKNKKIMVYLDLN